MPEPDSIDTVDPQGGIVYRITGDTTLHASVGRKTRFPHLKELYSKHAGGNPDLDEQKTIAYEVGAEHYLIDSVKVWASYFYNDVDDMIQRVRDEKKERMYVNIGEARTQGVEGGIDWEATDNFQIGANYTYLATKDKENDRDLPGRPRHRINLDLRYLFPFGLSASLQTSYTQRQFEYIDDESRKCPDFFLLDARISQRLGRLWGVGSELFAQVTNLTDKDYDEGHPMPGRNFLAGLTLRY